MTKFQINQLVTGLCIVSVVALAVTTLLGWAINTPILKTLLPDRPDMKANAAVCFLLLCFAISIDRSHIWGRLGKFIARFIPLLILTFSSLVLTEYIFGYDFGIDEFLFLDQINPHPISAPGRFAPFTAINFILLSTVLLLETLPTNPKFKVSQSLALITFLVSFQSFIGGLFGVNQIFGMHLFIPMAIPTAASFALLANAILASKWNKGFLERFTIDTPSAAMARNMMIAVLLAPVIIKALFGFGVLHDLYDEELSVFFEAIVTAIFMSAIVITTAGAFLKTERERQTLRARERLALKKAEAERDKLYSAFTQAPTHVDIFRGPEHYFELANPSTVQLAGFKDVSQLRLIDVFPDSDRNGILGSANKVYQTGESYRGTEISSEILGQTYYFDLSIQPWTELNGQIAGVIIFSVDVTEKVRARKILQEANDAKTQFLANISHEIRTPLGIILGFSDLAIDSLDDPGEAKKYLFSIRRNADELSKLLGEVLDLSKVEANKLEVEKIEFNLIDTIESAKDLLEIKARNKGISLEITVDKSVPLRISSDPTRLRQILVNLLGNSIKFTHAGYVHLKVSALNQAGRLTTLTFEVSDSGMGISSEHQTHLFQPFSQADGSVTRRFGGTGLGLALSRELARALGGDLTLQSSIPGKGSSFVFKIDVEVAASSSLQSSQSARALIPNLSHASILVVEDSVDNQVLISHFLKPTNARIVISNNGAEALEAVKESNFEVILMDIQMPVLDGFSAVKTLRERQIKTPIIALTAHALKEERQRAFTSGFNDYLTKPINKALLYQTLQRWINKAEATAPLNI